MNSSPSPIIQVEHAQILVNGINLHVITAGPKDGPMVILLHGFPEFWRGWRHQIPALAEAGFRVVVPDQRGYNLSDKPKGIAAYNLDELAADVIGLMDHVGKEKVFLVGHDWGGAVAWWTANKFPERLKRLVILNVPHHRVMNHNLRTNPIQKRRSWYMRFFQIPWIPEISLRTFNHRQAVHVLKNTSLSGTFSDSDLEAYRTAWGQKGAWTGMLNWYRAAFRYPPKRLASNKIEVPVMMIWGKKDTALGYEMAQPSIDLCVDGRLETIPDATHWVQHEQPEKVNRLMSQFFSG